MHYGLCYPWPVCAIFDVTEIHLCPISSGDKICYPRVGIGPPLDYMSTSYHWPYRQSSSDFPCHANLSSQAGAKRLYLGYQKAQRA